MGLEHDSSIQASLIENLIESNPGLSDLKPEDIQVLYWTARRSRANGQIIKCADESRAVSDELARRLEAGSKLEYIDLLKLQTTAASLGQAQATEELFRARLGELKLQLGLQRFKAARDIAHEFLDALNNQPAVKLGGQDKKVAFVDAVCAHLMTVGSAPKDIR